MVLVDTLYTEDYPCTSVLADSLPWLGYLWRYNNLITWSDIWVGFVDDRSEWECMGWETAPSQNEVTKWFIYNFCSSKSRSCWMRSCQFFHATCIKNRPSFILFITLLREEIFYIKDVSEYVYLIERLRWMLTILSSRNRVVGVQLSKQRKQNH